MSKITPVLRFFDLAKTLEFYVDWLGFKIDWEHRFGEKSPLYMAISRGEILIHLSEHHGDGSPGAKLLTQYDGHLNAWQSKLAAKDYHYFKPGMGKSDWNAAEMEVIDPVGNHLIFFQSLQNG